MAKRGKFQTNLEYYAARLLLGAVGLFPLSTSMKIGKSIGRLLSRYLPRLTKTGRRNLEIAMPELSESEKKRILNGTFESMGRHLGFVSHFDEFTPEKVREIVEVIGMENFEKARSSGRGILFFTGHFGSWEVFNLLPPAFGYGMNILVRRIDNPRVEEFVDKMRTRLGSATLDKKQAGRKMYRLLENGELLGILADLNVQERDSVFVDFFGIPASTTTSIARIAMKTNAVVLPAFAVWNEEKQKYIVHLEPQIEYETEGNYEENIENLTQKITTMVEKYVRVFPEQWLWIHKRWNTRPKGEKELY